METKIAVGIVGYGSLGQYLANAILTDPKASDKLKLVFVWNRTPDKIADLPPELRLTNLEDFADRGADLIVEVCHPDIVRNYGAKFLSKADLFVGSPTALSDQLLEQDLFSEAAKRTGHGLYIPSGALWGATDIQKMANRGTLKKLQITMKKHPRSLKLTGPLVQKLETCAPDKETVLYEGPVRGLCPLAPNNVNTMAAAAIAGHSLGFDGVQAKLVADPRLTTHVIEIEACGPGEAGNQLRVFTERINPAVTGAVTGSATYISFVSSVLNVRGCVDGVHLC